MKERIELFLGKRVHKTLKKLYRNLMYQKDNTLDDLIGFLHDEWAKNWNDSIVIVKGKYDQEDYLKMADEYITDYYFQYCPFNHERTIAIEKRIFGDLDKSSGYKLCGYIDRITKTDDGCYQIHDYKTSSRLPSPEDIRKDKQLALYAICLKERYPYIKNIRLIWHFLSGSLPELKTVVFDFFPLVFCFSSTKLQEYRWLWAFRPISTTSRRISKRCSSNYV